MKKTLLLLFLALGLIHHASASHIAGGDFSVEWISGNDYRVTLKMFRDCTSATDYDVPITVNVYDNVTNLVWQSFTMPLISRDTIDLGDECYSPPSTVCIEEGIYQTVITLIPNPNGYYMSWERCCRNASIQNISLPGSSGMVFYVQFPDVTYNNSTPIFGPYPTDGYLCQGVENIIDFGVTEADGDSLVYSLTTPLMGSSTTIPSSFPRPYTPINWQAPYNLADIVGGTPPMSIDPATGIITCFPTGTGVFAFAIMVEEYRAGVKISESFRDIQYYVLNCVFDDLPEIMLPDTISVVEGTNACFDIVVIDQDVTDTISILVSSPVTFADGATLGMPVPFSVSPDTTYQFFFTNETTGLPDSIVLPRPVDSGGAYYGIGAIGLHYCWATGCDDIVNSPFEIEVSAFSLGCSGDTNFLDQTTHVFVVPAPVTGHNSYMPDNINIVAGATPCFDLVVLAHNPADTINLVMQSSSFGLGATLTQPTPVSTSPNMYEYFYWNPSTGSQDSATLQQPWGSGKYYHGIGGVGLHYCWTTNCDHISEQQYRVQVGVYTLGCFGDTTFAYDHTSILVEPPTGVPGVVPNVFTPNGDKINDVFQLGGVFNYCYDTINIQIFNRWGQLVFESNDPTFEWDGTNTKGEALAEGTYYVLLNGIFGDADVTRHYPIQLFRNK